VQQLRGGGAETLVRGLCAGLVRSGTDVTVASIYDDGLTGAQRAALGFAVVAIGRRGRGDVAFFARLVAALRRLRPDVVHAHLHAGKYAGRFAALAAGIPNVVFTEHGEEPGGMLRGMLDRFLAPHTVRYITFAEAQRAALAAREGVPLERIAVIPNGVAMPPYAAREALRASLGIPPETFAAYVPARLTAQKDQALAIRAFARRWRPDSRRRLYLAGTGPDEAALRALATRLELGDRIVFLGYRDDAAVLARAMDLYLMSSVWERMPLALGEAMLVGLPVVTTPWDGVAEFVRDGETGFVADRHDVDALAEALGRAEDATLLATIAERAQRFAARRFDLERCVAAHQALYADLTRTTAS